MSVLTCKQLVDQTETTKRAFRSCSSASRQMSSTSVAGGLARLRQIANGSCPPGTTSIGSSRMTCRSWASWSVTGRMLAAIAVSSPSLRKNHRFFPSRDSVQRTGETGADLVGASFNRSTSTSSASTCFADEACVASSAAAYAFVAVICAAPAVWLARRVSRAIRRVAMIPAAVNPTIHQSASCGPNETGIVGIGEGMPRTLSGVTP